DDWPSEEVETIEEMPAMVASWRSIGAATEAAMVSALAPGSVAVVVVGGETTARGAATGRGREGKIPNTMNERGISVVITGRRMQASERFIAYDPAFASRGATLVPLLSSRWPLVTTDSPPVSPSAMMLSFSLVRATVTCWTFATLFLIT